MKREESTRRPARTGERVLSDLQIELTTRCPLRCRMCVREGSREWQSGEMPLADFRKLSPWLRAAQRVILQGWGESLLHGDLLEIVGLVKEAGPEVGFVTSGKGLDRGQISALVAAGVDFVGFSLGGASPETHNAIRENSDLERLLSDIESFREAAAAGKRGKPALHIVYLMLKENVHEVPSLTALAKRIGIRDVILTNLIHVSTGWQEEQRVFTCGAESRYEEILQEAEAKARELHLNLTRPALSPTEVLVCAENPLRNLYLSVEGEVSPCVYLQPPLPSPVKRIFCGREHRLDKVSFGNAFRQSFPAIWEGSEYLAFREGFAARRQKGEGAFSAVRVIDRLQGKTEAPLPDPPAPCASCHKMLGF